MYVNQLLPMSNMVKKYWLHFYSYQFSNAIKNLWHPLKVFKLMTFHWSGGRVGLNCRIIREEDKVIVEEINHGFINDGYDDYLYEDTGLIQL